MNHPDVDRSFNARVLPGADRCVPDPASGTTRPIRASGADVSADGDDQGPDAVHGGSLADVVWLSVTTIVDEKGLKETMPKTDEEWKKIRHGAIALAEAGASGDARPASGAAG